MKNGVRIFLVCLVLIGGTSLFGFWSFHRFNQSLNALRDTCFAIANQPPVLYCDKERAERVATNLTKKEPTPEPAPEPTPEPVSELIAEPIPEVTPASVTVTDPVPMPPKDLDIAFVFPKKDSQIYNGCTYQVTFESAAAIGSLATVLVDAGAKDIVDPTKSGLAKESDIDPTTKSLAWEVKSVWPGPYYIKVTDVNGVDVRSGVFSVKNLPKGISAEEKAKLCKV